MAKVRKSSILYAKSFYRSTLIDMVIAIDGWPKSSGNDKLSIKSIETGKFELTLR
jgi:hypothetical protein